jgi:hypothetical protein
VQEYLVPELCTPQIHHIQGRSRSPSIYSFAKYSGLLTRISTKGTTPQGLRISMEGFAMTRPTIYKIPEDHDMLPKAQIIISIEMYIK